MPSFIKGNEEIYIMHYPGYKKPILAYRDGTVVRKIASFNTDETADTLIEVLSRWLEIDDKEQTND